MKSERSTPRGSVTRFAYAIQEPRKRSTQFGRPAYADTTLGSFNRLWPSVRITSKAHGKMWALVQQCDIEISWLSSCHAKENGDIIIDDVFVPKQVCSICTTEIKADGEADLLGELLQTGQQDVINHLRCWGHSHVDMDVFASSQDEKQTHSFLRRQIKHGSEFFLRVIANKWGDLYCTVYLLDIGISVHHPVLLVENSNPALYFRWAQDQIKAEVTRHVFTHEAYAACPDDFEFNEVDSENLDYWFQTGGIDEELYTALRAELALAETKKEKS